MKQPNILLIMCDQLRWDYVGYVNPLIRTPNIDALAARGMIFENCITNAAICVPARVALATGVRNDLMGCVDNNYFLPLCEDTYYRRLRDSGYKVALSGKLDLAKPDFFNGTRGERPAMFSYGFTHPFEAEGKNHAFRNQSDRLLGPYGRMLQDKGELEAFVESQDAANRDNTSVFGKNTFASPLESSDHHDAYIAKHAAQWIRQADPEFPWHMFVSFAGPHKPYDPPAEYLKRMEGRELPDFIRDDLSGKPEFQKRVRQRFMKNTDDDIIRDAIRHYIAAIELIDDLVGQIIASLKETGMYEDTYIVFTADHGEMVGDHGMLAKHIHYEASSHVPLFVCGKGIAPGRTDTMVELADVGETICDLAHARARAGRMPTAKSFAPVLFGTAAEHREYAYSCERNYRFIRSRKYKYVENYNDQNELYDLENDPCEMNNIIREHPELQREFFLKIRQLEMPNKWD